LNEQSTHSSHKNPFWDYSLRLYKQQGVSGICLSWQDTFGANVNLLLFCCWVASKNGLLDEQTLSDLSVLVANWEERTVQRIRRLRRQVKGLPEPDEIQYFQHNAVQKQWYQELLKAELLAEQVEQRQLYGWWQELRSNKPVRVCSDAARAGSEKSRLLLVNLNNYLQTLGVGTVNDEHGLVRAARSVTMQHS